MNVESQIRSLARSFHFQELYNASKSLNGIALFDNTSNFSGLQVLFLRWLRTYSMLYQELDQKEWQNLDEKVIETDWRCDCFLHYRSKELTKKLVEGKKETQASKKVSIYKGPKGK